MTHPLTPEEGLNTLALTSLPPLHRKLIRLVLRQVEPTDAEVREAVAGWAENEQLDPAELDAALKTLVEQHYLIELNRETENRYKVSFSRRARRELTQDVWDADRVGTAPPMEKPVPADPPHPADEQTSS